MAKLKTRSDLKSKHCRACEDESAALTERQAKLLLGALDGWKSDGKQITKTYQLKNYFETIALVNAIAFMAHRENHHPDLEVGYNKCHVRYSTHAVGGLSENDFICAAKVDGLVQGD